VEMVITSGSIQYRGITGWLGNC